MVLSTEVKCHKIPGVKGSLEKAHIALAEQGRPAVREKPMLGREASARGHVGWRKCPPIALSGQEKNCS